MLWLTYNFCLLPWTFFVPFFPFFGFVFFVFLDIILIYFILMQHDFVEIVCFETYGCTTVFWNVLFTFISCKNFWRQGSAILVILGWFLPCHASYWFQPDSYKIKMKISIIKITWIKVKISKADYFDVQTYLLTYRLRLTSVSLNLHFCYFCVFV